MSASIHSRRYAEHRELQGASREVQWGDAEVHQEAREVRGAEKCRAGPLRREVLRAAGVPNGAAVECGAAAQLGWEMRKRGPSIGSCASTVDVRGCRVQGGPMIVSIAHGFRKRSRVCVYGRRELRSGCPVCASRGVTRGPMRVGRSISRHAPGELGDWMHLCVSWSRAVRSRRVP